MKTRVIQLLFAMLLLALPPAAMRAAAQEQGAGSELFGEAGQRVVYNNGEPAVRFISRTGSSAYVYYRKRGEEDTFAVNVYDWDTFKIRTGWLFISRDTVSFVSDEDKKRDFSVPRAEVKKVKGQGTWNGMNFLLVKVKGGEKRFMVSYVPVPPSRTGFWGAHQKPAFEYLERLVKNYDEAEAEFKQSLAKIKIDPVLAPNAAPAAQVNAPHPAESKAAAEVTSEPAGAETYVDGAFSGSTPSKLQLTVGEHTIKVTRPGYKDWERKVSIEAGSAKTLHAILEPAGGPR